MFLAIETTYLSNANDVNAVVNTEACVKSFYNDMNDIISSIKKV